MSRYYSSKDQKRRYLLIGIGVTVVLAILAFIIPWGAIGDRMARDSNMPGVGESVTSEQAQNMITDGDGRGLYEASYWPVKRVNRYMGTWKTPTDDIVLHGVVTLWTYCPDMGEVVNKCADQAFNVDPSVITTSEWDGRVNQHSKVKLAGVIIPVNDTHNLYCLTPTKLKIDSLTKTPQFVTDLGDKTTDGKLHELLVDTTLEDPWRCRGREV